MAGADGVSDAELAERIATVLPDGVEAITGDDLADEQLAAAGFVDMIRVFLVVFAGIALVVAALSINNTFTITVAQRTRELALLRAVGASRRQVRRVVTAEAAVVGVVSSIIGVAGGLVVAGLLKGLFDAFGFALPAGGLAIRPLSIVAGFVVGIVATVIAARAPARRASGVSPLAALRDASAEAGSIGRRRIVVGVALAAIGIGTPGGRRVRHRRPGRGRIRPRAGGDADAGAARRPSRRRRRSARVLSAHTGPPRATGPGQRHAQPAPHGIDGHRAGGRRRRGVAVHGVRGVAAHGHRRRGARRVRRRRSRAGHPDLRWW